MVVALTFWLLLGGTLFLAWQMGGRDDRKLILWIAAAAVATFACSFLNITERRWAVRGVDLILFAVASRYALASDRHWPLWFAGIMGAAVFIGAVALLLPVDQSEPLFLLSSSMAGPSLVVMIAGLALDWRKGYRHLGNGRAPTT